MKTLIIAGFPGVGKTKFAKQYPDQIIDMDSTYWDSLEKYVNTIIYKYENGKYQYILISTHPEVLSRLREADVPYDLVIPNKNQLENYVKRYNTRGDSDDFINLIIKNWDSWLDELNKDDQLAVTMSTGYLTDVYVAPITELLDPATKDPLDRLLDKIASALVLVGNKDSARTIMCLRQTLLDGGIKTVEQLNRRLT